MRAVGGAVWHTTRELYRGWTLGTILFTVSLDTAEWLADYQNGGAGPDKNLGDLFGMVGIDLMKATLSAVLGTFLVWFLLAASGVFMAEVAGFVVLLAVGTVFAASAASLFLEYLDQWTGASETFERGFHNIWAYLASLYPDDYAVDPEHLGDDLPAQPSLP